MSCTLPLADTWDNVFYMLVAADAMAVLLLSRIVVREVGRVGVPDARMLDARCLISASHRVVLQVRQLLGK
jgi:hypothetical protein